MSQNESSLVLGTAQIGLPYGIKNKMGQPEQQIATSIIREAWANGIREFDTAQGYGRSEHVLGKALSDLGITKEAKVISKFDPNLDHLDLKAMSCALNESLSRIGVPYLYAMMLHREGKLSLLNEGLSGILHEFILSGKVKYIGVSVYSPDKAIQALSVEGIDIVQLPTNILDRRFEEAGVFQLAYEKKKKIYIRSVFLQGLILMDTEELPENMVFAKEIIDKIKHLSVDLGLTRQEVAISYLKKAFPNVKIIFGVDTPEQVRENVSYWEKNPPESLVFTIRDVFKSVAEKILNPVLWPK